MTAAVYFVDQAKVEPVKDFASGNVSLARSAGVQTILERARSRAKMVCYLPWRCSNHQEEAATSSAAAHCALPQNSAVLLSATAADDRPMFFVGFKKI